MPAPAEGGEHLARSPQRPAECELRDLAAVTLTACLVIPVDRVPSCLCRFAQKCEGLNISRM